MDDSVTTEVRGPPPGKSQRPSHTHLQDLATDGLMLKNSANMTLSVKHLVLLLALLLLSACDDGSQPEVSKDGAGSTAIREAARVTVMTVTRQPMIHQVTYTGNLEAARVARIIPEMLGRIVALTGEIGDPIQEGAVLVKMDKSALWYQYRQAEAGLALARANLADAKSTWERVQFMHQEDAVSEQQVEKARLGRDVAKAQLGQARAGRDLLKVQLDKAILRAPFTGVITQKGAEVGDLFSAGGAMAPLYTVMDISKIKVAFQVPQQEIAAIRRGQPCTLEVSGLNQPPAVGNIAILSPAADPVSKTFYVEAHFDNPDETLPPGAFGQVTIEIDRLEHVLPIPRTGLTTDRKVFVVEDGVARARTVEVGLTTADQVEITQGLQEGETVVVDGAYILTDGATVTVEEG